MDDDEEPPEWVRDVDVPEDEVLPDDVPEDECDRDDVPEDEVGRNEVPEDEVEPDDVAEGEVERDEVPEDEDDPVNRLHQDPAGRGGGGWPPGGLGGRVTGVPGEPGGKPGRSVLPGGCVATGGRTCSPLPLSGSGRWRSEPSAGGG